MDTVGEDMVPDFQSALDTWAGGLIATGGALAPLKSYCYMIDFVWTGDSWEYRTINDLPGSFTLLDKLGNRAALKRHEVSYAERTLGVCISMNGNEDAEMERLKEHAKLFADQMRTSKCSKNHAIYTYNFSFMKTLEYAMPVTQFSNTEWNRIVSPALIPSLQKTGLVKSFPHAILYGPDLYQGFQVMHPYYNQEICHIMTHLQESANGSQTGLLLRGTAEAFRLELGLPFSLGSTNYKICSAYTTDCWYKHLWEFVERNPIDIIEDFPDMPLLRDGDSYLMQAFIDAGFRGKELKRLNIMRMAMQVVTVSDIATPDGRRLTLSAYLLQNSNGLRTLYDWPRSPPGEFSKAYVGLWQEALRKSLVNPHNGQSSRTLLFCFQVGTWRDSSVFDFWEWFESPEEQRLYQRLGQG